MTTVFGGDDAFAPAAAAGGKGCPKLFHVFFLSLSQNNIRKGMHFDEERYVNRLKKNALRMIRWSTWSSFFFSLFPHFMLCTSILYFFKKYFIRTARVKIFLSHSLDVFFFLADEVNEGALFFDVLNK